MTKQYLTFSLNSKIYAINVFQVQEVLTYIEPTKLPCTSPHIEGLINSRNQGITVVNFRKKFALEDTEVTKFTRIIVLELPSPTSEDENHVTLFGAVADSVNEVIEIDDETIEPPPKFGNAISAEFITGICKKEDSFISILDIEKVFAEESASIVPTEVPEE